VEPSVVVLDDPTVMLDALHTQADIMHLLGSIQQRTGVCFVLISHNHKLVGRFSRCVCRMENGVLQAMRTSARIETEGYEKGEILSLGT